MLRGISHGEPAIPLPFRLPLFPRSLFSLYAALFLYSHRPDNLGGHLKLADKVQANIQPLSDAGYRTFRVGVFRHNARSSSLERPL